MIQLVRRLHLKPRLILLFSVSGLLIILALLLALMVYRYTVVNLAFSSALEENSLKTQIILLFVVLTFALFLHAVFSFWIIKSILKPIKKLRAEITAFQLEQSENLSDDLSNDELGELTRTIKHLTQILRQSYLTMDERAVQRNQALAQRVLHLQTAAELARETTSFENIEILLDRAVNLISDRFEMYYVGVYLLDSENRFAILKSTNQGVGKILIERGHRVLVGSVNFVGNVSASGQSRVVNNAEEDFYFQRDSVLVNTRSQAVLPLRIGSLMIGALDVHSEKVDKFDTNTLVVLQIMADQLSVAIRNASLVSDLKTRISEAQMLYHRYAQESWSRIRSDDRVNGYEYDLVNLSPLRESLPEALWSKLQNGKPIISEQVNGEAGGTKKTLYIPLMMHNQLIGVLGLINPSDDRDWSDDDIDVMQTITNQIALGIDNARLLEETQRRTDQIRLLHEVTLIASSEVGLPNLLNSISKKIYTEFHLDSCDVLWIEPDGISAVVIASEPEIINTIATTSTKTNIAVVENPLFQQLTDLNHSLELYDLNHNPLAVSLRPIVRSRKLENMLVVPLMMRGELCGAILMGIENASRRFGEDEIHVMDQLCLQLSSALEVAHTYEQANRRAERERQISEVTQNIRQTLDLTSILRTAAQEIWQVLDVPDVTIRIIPPIQNNEQANNVMHNSEKLENS